MARSAEFYTQVFGWQRDGAATPIGADAPEITGRFRDPGGNLIGLYQQPKTIPAR